jgi:hypothetical protein
VIKLQKIKPKKLTDFKNLLALTFLAVFASWQGQFLQHFNCVCGKHLKMK